MTTVQLIAVFFLIVWGVFFCLGFLHFSEEEMESNMIYSAIPPNAFSLNGNYSFIGSVPDETLLPSSARKGEMLYVSTSKSFFLFDGKEWSKCDRAIETIDALDRRNRKAITSCPNCGAPYEGKERCEYCGTYLG